MSFAGIECVCVYMAVVAGRDSVGFVFFLQAEDGIRDTSVTGVQSCFSSRRRHTRYIGDWSSDVCSSDLRAAGADLARMSGSGATCFGLFSDGDTVARAAEKLTERHARWWVCPTVLQIGRASCRERV